MKLLLNWQRPKAKFKYPSPPAPRTAVLEPWFAAESGPVIRVFQPDDLERGLGPFAPQAIAASWRRLKELAGSANWHGKIAPTHAIVVLHRAVGDAPLPSPLSAVDREWLWRAFRVPIFEQVIGPRGILLAAECAAHNGLHIEMANWEPAEGVERSTCGCGRSTPRLVASGTPSHAAAHAR